jgi:WD40 repeat protein
MTYHPYHVVAYTHTDWQQTTCKIDLLAMREPTKYGSISLSKNRYVFSFNKSIIFTQVPISDKLDFFLEPWLFENPKLIGHTDEILCLIKLSDGRLVSGSNDTTIRIWDWDFCRIRRHGRCRQKRRHREQPRVLTGHQQGVTHLLELSDGRLVSCSDREIRIWSLKMDDDKVVGELIGEHSHIVRLTELDDGRLASCSFRSCTVRIWDIRIVPSNTIEVAYTGFFVQLFYTKTDQLEWTDRLYKEVHEVRFPRELWLIIVLYCQNTVESFVK